MAAPKPIWVRQAEEAKLKSEAETAAAAKAAFDATFKSLTAAGEPNASSSPSSGGASAAAGGGGGDSDDEDRPEKPPGPVDPSKCLAAGPGIAGGSAGSPATLTVVAKDRDGRKVPRGGAQVRVRVAPGVGVGGDDIEAVVKDQGDGTYAVTYAVAKRGNYMVHVELDGSPVMGSPFPVFFSASVGPAVAAASAVAATFPTTLATTTTATSSYPNMINQTMPNMPNYAGSVSGAFPSMLGLIPGTSAGASGGVVLQGVGASLGEICREYLNGRCAKADCKFSHPPHQLLMSVLAATTSMGSLSQAPMAPSAAAMAAAQAIMAAQALQAHAAQMQAKNKDSEGSSGSLDKADKGDALKKTVQVSNLSPLLTVEHLKQLFGYYGTVVDCTITDSKHFAYIEYSKPEEAAKGLALNNMDVGGRPLNVEMAKSLPPKSSLINNASLPLMMQQAVQLQQMQFQQALVLQQTIASQQAAARAATMKSATEMAAARAAEISRKLKAEGLGGGDVDEKDTKKKSRSPSPPPQRSKSRSRSPIKYRRSRRSRSFSPPVTRHSRHHRSRSPVRSHHSKYGSERSYRDDRESYSRSVRRESDRSRDHYSSSSRRNRSRSISPRYKKSSRAESRSPKRRESISPSKPTRSSRAGSRSPQHQKGSQSSPTRGHRSYRSRHSRSRSQEKKHHSSDKKDSRKSEMQDDKRKSGRSSRGDKDHTSSRDLKQNNKVDTSTVARKRSSSLPEDEMPNIEHRSKKSKSDDSLENVSKKDEEHNQDDMELTEDKRFLDSPSSKSQKRSMAENDNNHNQSHDSSRHNKIKSDYKKRDKDDSSRAERKYAAEEARNSRDDKVSRHSSSRSHRSSHHSRERYDRDARDQHKSKKPEEAVRPRKSNSSIEEPLHSDKRKHRSENSPSQKHNNSGTCLDSDANQSGTEFSIDGGQKRVDSEQKLEVLKQSAALEETDLSSKRAQQLVCETDGSTKDKSSAGYLSPLGNTECSSPQEQARGEVYSIVADLNGQTGPETDGSLGDLHQSRI